MVDVSVGREELVKVFSFPDTVEGFENMVTHLIDQHRFAQIGRMPQAMFQV